MLVENSRAFLSRFFGSRQKRPPLAPLAGRTTAYKVSGPGLEYLNADNAWCGIPGRLDGGFFGWKNAAVQSIHVRSVDC